MCRSRWASVRFLFPSYRKFTTLAAEWWDDNIISPAQTEEALPAPEVQAAPSDELLVVDPATLNGVALIETIRILYRRVGPQDFEEALDELRDVLCMQSKSASQGEE